MKKVLYLLPLIILVSGIVIFYWPFFWGSIATISSHQIVVKDVVTGNPIEGVTLGFTFGDYCHPEDVLRGGYDYATCDGRYETVSPAVTNKQGIAEPNISVTNHPPAGAIRYFIEDAPGYHPTRSYGLMYHDTVWLVPLDAPVESKEAAVAFLKMQPSMQKIFDFYSTNNIEWEYLYAEEEAWYGVWRVRLNLSGEIIRNRFLTVLVHPDASGYVICNPEYQITTGTTEERFAEMNRERDFLKTLPESHEHRFGREGCSPELLLN